MRKSYLLLFFVGLINFLVYGKNDLSVAQREIKNDHKVTRTTVTLEKPNELRTGDVPVLPHKHLTKEKDLSKKEIRREVKKILRETERRTVFLTILLVFIAIVFPPLAVLLVDGLKGPFWLSILLTLLLYFPGLIYALYRVLKG